MDAAPTRSTDRSPSAALRLAPLLALCLLAAGAHWHRLETEPAVLDQAGAERRLLETTSGGSLRFVVVGDTQDNGNTGGGINDEVWPRMALDMNAHEPAFALFCGDLVSGGSLGLTQNQWQDWLQATAPFNGLRYMTPGNHDMYGGSGSVTAWGQNFPWLPTANSPAGEEGTSYFFDAGNSRFISVTTDYESGGGAPNQSWLDSVLQASAGFEHVFVFSHRPVMFSSVESTGGSSGAFWQSLVGSDVAAYFSGHWHRYQPDRIGAGGDTWETVIGTGGGWQGFEPIRPYQQVKGYLLVEVDGTEATGTFYADADGDGNFDDALDSYVIASATPEPRGLVAEYRFDDGTASDSAPAPLGKQVHGALHGQASIGAGLSGTGALVLDGDDDFVEAGAIGDYNLSLNADLSISVFASYRSLAGGTWDNNLLSYGTSDYYTQDEETNYSYSLGLSSSGSLTSFWEYGNGSNVSVTSTVAAQVAADQTHHYAMTRDAESMTVRFYVDGQQLGQPVSFDQLPTGGGRGMLYLGSWDIDDLSYFEWDGSLDDVRIYNHVLDAAEIAALSRPSPGLAATNFLAGQLATLTLENCTPGGSLLLAYSLSGPGPLPTPFGALGLSPPLALLPALSANSGGGAQLSVPLPAAAQGLALWIQALDVAAPVLSNPLALVIG